MIQRNSALVTTAQARMVEMMEEDGIVSPPNAGREREVIYRRSLCEG